MVFNHFGQAQKIVAILLDSLASSKAYIKVTKVSLRSQRFEFGSECFALNLTLEQMNQ